MKLGFSTKYWPEYTLKDFVALANESKFNAIEIHDIGFVTSHAEKIRKLFFSNGIEIAAINSNFNIAKKDDQESLYMTLAGLMKAANRIHCRYIKVYAESDDENAVDECIDFLSKAIPIAEAAGITILIVTRDLFADTEKLATVLKHFACDNLAADWNMHDTYFNAGEDAETTIKNLGAYVKLVHVVDQTMDRQYALLGEGDLPIADMINALRSVNYEGVICLEWNPKFLPEVDDLEVILIHYYHTMHSLTANAKVSSHYYYNKTHTGKFLWKKEALIDKTFPQVLDSMVEEFPDQIAFKYTTLDYTRTYSEFRDDVDTFARALIAMGVKKGTQVAVWATNVPEWYIAFWATTKIGAVLVTVNTAYKIAELEYLLRQSDTHTLIMIEGNKGNSYKETVEALCPELKETTKGKPLHAKRLPFLRNVITVGFRQKGCLTFDEAVARKTLVPLEIVERMADEVKVDDVCNMQYTSGTTGFPKGVMLTHYNVVNNGKCIGDRMGLSTADRMMIQVPMFHCFGMVLSMTSSITHGVTMCPMPYFSAKSSLACINQERITCFNGVPTMFIAMFNHADYRRTDFSHMRTGIMAGSGCPPELMRRAARPDEMNMQGIVSVYGQTESAPGSTMSAWTDSIDVRCDTVGYPFPHVQCKIIDPETGLEVPAGVNGEFCSRGYNTMKGYYKMPEATAQTIDADGWLHSGDIACADERGNFKITGRLKDMIIRGGENIYPKEIEEFIYTHPKVKDVQVIAVPDRKYGEEAMACIVLKEGESVTEPEMRAYIMDHLARHKVPKYIDFVEGFPMNAAGKVLKYKMREAAVAKYGLDKN